MSFVQQNMNFKFKQLSMFVFLMFQKNGLVEINLSFENLPEHKIS
jgi:hypothetical protein